MTFPLDVEVDEIDNLACPAFPIHYQFDPVHCYVDDLIEGFIRLMNSPDELAGPVNLGNPVEFTMIELAETILELTGSRSALVHEALPQDDPRQRKPDIGLAQDRLGWEPTVALRDGLKPTIEYFEGLLRRTGGSLAAERDCILGT